MANRIDLPELYQLFDSSLSPDQSQVKHFNVFRIEDMLLSQLKPSSYSRRSYFKVSLLVGHSKIHYADRCIEVLDSALIFTNPLIPYYWERVAERPSGYVCVFTESFFSRFENIQAYPVFQSPDAAVVPLTSGEIPQFLSLFQRMIDEIGGNYVYKYDFTRNLLLEVVHEAQKLKPALGAPLASTNAAERITSLFAELLERQFPIEQNSQVLRLKTPATFARQLNIHINHLNKALRETTGQTTSQLISKRIYEEARILLKSTNWTISEIAWCLGFEESNHFSSFFKSQGGTSPKQFRQSSAD